MVPLPRESYCVSRIVKNFSSDEPWTIAINGESLSDDLKKKKSQGRNPRTHKTKSSANRRQKSSANSRQRRESVMAMRRLEYETKLQSGGTQFW